MKKILIWTATLHIKRDFKTQGRVSPSQPGCTSILTGISSAGRSAAPTSPTCFWFVPSSRQPQGCSAVATVIVATPAVSSGLCKARHCWQGLLSRNMKWVKYTLLKSGGCCGFCFSLNSLHWRPLQLRFYRKGSTSFAIIFHIVSPIYSVRVCVLAAVFLECKLNHVYALLRDNSVYLSIMSKVEIKTTHTHTGKERPSPVY